MFEAAEAYERDMGRWSKRLAPLFVEFVGVENGDRVLDVGCGTGSLAWTIDKTTAAAKIVGIDPSAGFLDYARSHYSDSRLTFEVGDAQRLPFPDTAFDRCLSLLVMRHIPDASKATSEMRRITRPGGVLGTAMWDSSGGHQLNQCLWDAAAALHWQGELPVENESYGSPEQLRSLWARAELTNIEVKELSFPCEFSSVDELWIRRFIEGQGITAAYVKGLSEDRRAVLRERLRHNLLGNRPDGPFTLTAKAWAIRGTVPPG
ncbi:MAG TPA: methyltransferase domain-containing protein [Candidatus Binatia bacterium]|jgi:ubiquinone/menaquinone biosynthesis C-methylase UbiE